MEKVVGYCRVSSECQCQEDKFGIEAQRAEIEAYCAENGFEVVDWYIDEAKSGAKMDRPELDRVLYHELPTGVKGVVVAKSDRIARDIEIYYYYKMTLRMKGIELYSALEDFGAPGPMRDLLESFTLCAAKMERENIFRRTMMGKRVKAEQGGFIGGRPPFGYKIMNGGLEIDEEKARIVLYVTDLREQGLPYRTICRKVVEDGLMEKEPTLPLVHRIIENRKIYEGYMRFDGEWIKGRHEPILEEK